jgi:hypothetical protein
MRPSAFDHRPLRDLGAALREFLQPLDNQDFVDRVMAVARVGDRSLFRGDGWEVLSGWARPGLAAAAAIIVLAMAVSLSMGTRGPAYVVTIDDALQAPTAATAPSLLVASPNPPDVDIVLAVSFER